MDILYICIMYTQVIHVLVYVGVNIIHPLACGVVR
jgi:hypothetical protein